jgi:uncharacterized membrane protein
MDSKWTSRKFWMAVIASVVGIVTTIWGTAAGEMVSTIAGTVLTVLVAIGYITAEAKIDAARAWGESQKTGKK